MGNQGAMASVGVSATQLVRAPIERVYAAWVDPTLMPRWMGIQAITELSGPLDRPGTTFADVVFGPYSYLALQRDTDTMRNETAMIAGLGSVRGFDPSLRLRPALLASVRGLHALPRGMNVVSAHVVLSEAADPSAVLDHLYRCLSGHFDIEHSTFQLESADRRRLEEADHV